MGTEKCMEQCVSPSQAGDAACAPVSSWKWGAPVGSLLEPHVVVTSQWKCLPFRLCSLVATSIPFQPLLSLFPLSHWALSRMLPALCHICWPGPPPASNTHCSASAHREHLQFKEFLPLIYPNGTQTKFKVIKPALPSNCSDRDVNFS